MSANCCNHDLLWHNGVGNVVKRAISLHDIKLAYKYRTSTLFHFTEFISVYKMFHVDKKKNANMFTAINLIIYLNLIILIRIRKVKGNYLLNSFFF